jgi:hypothetical protein
MKKILGAGILFVLTLTVGAVLIGAISPLKSRALPPLPPRPTPEKTPTSVPDIPSSNGSPSDGGLITLYVHAGPEVMREIGHWQTIWTEVQWQDGLRNWHDVSGWRGILDRFSDGLGRKTWWVADGHLGAGPFRWVVYQERGGEPLAYSEPFYLPSHPGRIVTVEVSLASQ